MTGETYRGRARHRAGVWMCVAVAAFGWTLPTTRAQEAQLVANGFRALDADRYELALNMFERARGQAPESAELLTYVGLGQFKLERHDDALESFDHARQLDSDIIDSAFLFYRASCLRALGLGQLEHTAWKELIEFDPHSQFAALAREAAGDDPPPLKPAQRELLVHNGQTCWERQPRLAAAYYREALFNDPSSDAPDVIAHLVAALNQAQDFSAAAAAATSALARPRAPDAGSYWHSELGVAYMGMEEWEQAAAALANVAPESAWRGQATVLRALCLSHLDRRGEARLLLKTINPADVPNLGDDIDQLIERLDKPTTRQAM